MRLEFALLSVKSGRSPPPPNSVPSSMARGDVGGGRKGGKKIEKKKDRVKILALGNLNYPLSILRDLGIILYAYALAKNSGSLSIKVDFPTEKISLKELEGRAGSLEVSMSREKSRESITSIPPLRRWTP